MKRIVVAAAVLAVGGVVAALLLTRGHKDLVKIELRAKPVATIRMHGTSLGTTPKVIGVPRGNRPIELEATFTVHQVNAMTGQKKVEVYRQTRTVTPDAPQAVDFDIKAATKQPDPN